MKTGLGRRIAFLFIRAIGHRSIGLAYALVGSDTVLASVIPSNGARVGGVVFPIAKSLAEAYDSTPGPTRRRLGAFLMVTVYQCDVVACAIFLTGQLSNVLIAKFARDFGGVDARRQALRAVELTRMGAIKRDELIMLLVFALIALLWMTTGWHQLNYAVVTIAIWSTIGFAWWKTLGWW